MKKIKLLSLIIVMALAISGLAGCGNNPAPTPDSAQDQAGSQQAQLPPGEGERTSVSFIVNGNLIEEDYCVLDTNILTVAYDDKVLRAEKPDMDDREIASFESADPLDLDIEIYASKMGDYASAAANALNEEINDEDTLLHSQQPSDMDVNGNKAKYFTVSDEDSCSEYFFIEYTGTAASGISYVVFEASYSKAFTTEWSPRLYTMAKTISFK